MVTVCQKCGVTGFLELLIYCIHCQVSAEHRYCLDEMPKSDDEEVTWSCEQCVPRIIKESSLNNVSSHPTRKSECKNPSDGAAQVLASLEKRKKENISCLTDVQRCDIAPTLRPSQSYMEDALLEPAQLMNDRSPPIKEDKSSCSCSGNNGGDHKPEKQRRLTLEDGGNSAEDAESVTVRGLQEDLDAGLSHHPSMLYHSYVHAQPIIDSVWKGCFDICNEKYGTVVAHLSNKACIKVCKRANALPPLICMEMLPRIEAWPKSFSISAPMDDDIALYFFPGSGRDEKIVDGLVHHIIDQDLALKAVIDSAELLVFSSCQLPLQNWRFCGKYYLWGVFRRRQVPIPKKSADNLLDQNSSTEPVVTKLATDVGSREERDQTKTWFMRCPRISPFKHE